MAEVRHSTARTRGAVRTPSPACSNSGQAGSPRAPPGREPAGRGRTWRVGLARRPQGSARPGSLLRGEGSAPLKTLSSQARLGDRARRRGSSSLGAARTPALAWTSPRRTTGAQGLSHGTSRPPNWHWARSPHILPRLSAPLPLAQHRPLQRARGGSASRGDAATGRCQGHRVTLQPWSLLPAAPHACRGLHCWESGEAHLSPSRPGPDLDSPAGTHACGDTVTTVTPSLLVWKGGSMLHHGRGGQRASGRPAGLRSPHAVRPQDGVRRRPEAVGGGPGSRRGKPGVDVSPRRGR